jgi:hypothetical protein
LGPAWNLGQLHESVEHFAIRGPLRLRKRRSSAIRGILLGSRTFTDISQFAKIAPHLVNPFVLIGFCLLLFFGVHRTLLKTGMLTALSQRQSSVVVRIILKYGFWVAIAIVIFGFAYAGLRTYHDVSVERGQHGPITQQAGPCGSNIAGNNNTTDVRCGDKAASTK